MALSSALTSAMLDVQFNAAVVLDRLVDHGEGRITVLREPHIAAALEALLRRKPASRKLRQLARGTLQVLPARAGIRGRFHFSFRRAAANFCTLFRCLFAPRRCHVGLSGGGRGDMRYASFASAAHTFISNAFLSISAMLLLLQMLSNALKCSQMLLLLVKYAWCENFPSPSREPLRPSNALKCSLNALKCSQMGSDQIPSTGFAIIASEIRLVQTFNSRARVLFKMAMAILDYSTSPCLAR